MSIEDPPADAARTASRALGLRERVAAALAQGRTTPQAPPAETERLITAWTQGTVYEDPALFKERLAALGCGPGQFARAISTSDLDAAPRARELSAFFELLVQSAEEAGAWAAGKVGIAQQPRVDFGYALPVVNYLAETKVAPAVASLASKTLLDGHALASTYLEQYNKSVKLILYPALVEELHVARDAGLLRGDSSEARYRDFVLRLTADPPWVRYFFEEYPVLLHFCERFQTLRIDAFLELLRRYVEDEPAIRQRFGIAPEDRLASVDVEQGDTHRHGRSVAVLHFTSGAQVVYKPRALALDAAFGELAQWVSQHGLDLELRVPAVLERGSYGWAEFVTPRACESAAEVRAFYRRAGALLAIAHALGSVDLINENIIASGEHPYLIDLECIYAKAFPVPVRDMPPSPLATRARIGSVLMTGMVPTWRLGDADGSGLIVGGLYPLHGQTRSGKVPRWVDPFTDQMRQELQTITFEAADHHIPRLGGQAVNPLDYVEEIIDGFRRAYRAIHEHHAEFLEERGPVARLLGCPARVLFRSTSDYSLCLMNVFHPDHLGDGLAAARALEYVWGAHSQLHPGEVLQSELDQLWEGDIPYFTSSGQSTAVRDGDGTTLVEAFFPERSSEAIRARVARMGPEDRALQEALIRRSLELHCVGDREYPRIPIDPAATEPAGTGSLLLEAARRIADTLLARAVRTDDECGWIGPTMGRHGVWHVEALRTGLYEGACGHALLYLYLWRVTQDERYRDAALGIWESLRKELLQHRFAGSTYRGAEEVFVSGFHGAVSALYAMAHVASVLGPALWSDELAAFILDWLEARIAHDRHFDYLHGGAGAIPVLVNAVRGDLRERALRLAERCGRHVIEHSEGGPAGRFWTTRQFAKAGGLAHGTAGYALSLAMLGRAVDNADFVEGGLEALAYDRSLYDPDRQGWAYVPLPGETRSFWCHGSGGIALSRLLLAELVPAPGLAEELALAERDLLRNGFGSRDCICHGDFGNLEILFALGARKGDVTLQRAVRAHARTLAEARSPGMAWACGLADRVVQLDGMFQGTVGVAYALLRLAAWDQVPSVLCLEGPAFEWACLHTVAPAKARVAAAG